MPTQNIKLIDSIYFRFFSLLRTLFAFLPRRLCLSAGQALGACFFHLDRKHRGLALANLEKAFGAGLSSAQRRAIARDSFRRFGRVTADSLKWIRLDPAQRMKLLKIEGEEYIRRALGQGRGVLLFTAHFGNWEVAAMAVSRIGTLNVVARPLDNPLVERELVLFRTSLGARIISKFQAVRPILQALRRNEIVAILIDQNVLRSQAVFVDFFGLPAATTSSLASFYLRARSPLIPVFCHSGPDSSYLVRIGPPVESELSGDLDRDVLKITQACTKMIEAEIRTDPGSWFWFHNRWKTRPKAETDSPPPAVRDF